MRIGIDFDNTIICYDQVFAELAIAKKLVPTDFVGTKTQLRDELHKLPDGDTAWQHLQGKAYGLEIKRASMFTGFKEFIKACNQTPNIELFIVSHKTEFGHFDETRTSLRDAARNWLRQEQLFGNMSPYIKENHVFFETTREEKIERIKALNCTHFIDDLIEVLDAPQFPTDIERILFQPEASLPDDDSHSIKHVYSHWRDIHHALLGS